MENKILNKLWSQGMPHLLAVEITDYYKKHVTEIDSSSRPKIIYDTQEMIRRAIFEEIQFLEAVNNN